MSRYHPKRASLYALLSLGLCQLCSLVCAQSPVNIKAVWTDMSMYAPSDQMRVTAWISDLVPVTRVTADGTELTRVSGIFWEGMVSPAAERGRHPVLVQAYYDGGVAEDSSCTYTTAGVVMLTTRSLLAPAAAAAKGTFLFTVCGCVEVLDQATFLVADGSSAPVQVSCEGHGLATGDMVRARGEWRQRLSWSLVCRGVDISRY